MNITLRDSRRVLNLSFFLSKTTDKDMFFRTASSYTGTDDATFCQDSFTAIAPGVFAAIGVVGVVCNGLVLLTMFLVSSVRSRSSGYLRNLATSDLMLCLLLLLPWVIKLSTGGLSLLKVQCLGFLCIFVLFTTGSIYTITVISLDRYMGIVHPLRRTAQIMSYGDKKALTVVWALASTASLPALVCLSQSTNDKSVVNILDCHRHQYSWFMGISAFLFFLLPLCTMAECYRRINSELCTRARSLTMGIIPMKQNGPSGGESESFHMRFRIHCRERSSAASSVHTRLSQDSSRLTRSGPHEAISGESLSSHHQGLGKEPQSNQQDNQHHLPIRRRNSAARLPPSRQLLGENQTSQTQLPEVSDPSSDASRGTSSYLRRKITHDTPNTVSWLPDGSQTLVKERMVEEHSLDDARSISEPPGLSDHANGSETAFKQGLEMNTPTWKAQLQHSASIPHIFTIVKQKLRSANDPISETRSIRSWLGDIPIRTDKSQGSLISGRSGSRRGSGIHTPLGLPRTAAKAKTTMLFIIVMFILLWFPYFVLLPLCGPSGLAEDEANCCFVMPWLGLCHSLINPFTYAWFKADFRRALMLFLRCRCRSKRRVSVLHITESEMQFK